MGKLRDDIIVVRTMDNLVGARMEVHFAFVVRNRKRACPAKVGEVEFL